MDKLFSTVSLFSGAGGFDLGFHLTKKFTTWVTNELKEEPAETLAKNLNMNMVFTSEELNIDKLPMMVQGDVADVNFDQLAQRLKPHVLIGGPPCQDFSVVKGDLRKGIEVNRGKLYAQFIRALISMTPYLFIFENVPGFMSANDGKAYRSVLEDFTNLSIRWPEITQNVLVRGRRECEVNSNYKILFSGIVNASKLGVPQTRRRLIIIGLRGDLADNLGELTVEKIKMKLDDKLNGRGTLLEKYPMTPIEIFEGLPLSKLGEKYRKVMQDYEGIWNDNTSPRVQKWKEKIWDQLAFDVKRDYLFINKIDEKKNEFEKAMKEHELILKRISYLGRPLRGLHPDDGSNIMPKEPHTVTERMWRIPPGENHEAVRNTDWHVEGRGLSLIYRRACPLKPAPTVVAYGGGGTWGYHYERSRGKLTNRERARLQTFTDDYLFEGKVGKVRAQIGEAVPPLLGLKIAEALLELNILPQIAETQELFNNKLPNRALG